MKIVVSNPKDGKSYQADVPKDRENGLIGKKVGDELDGGLVGALGYKLKIAGGSDFAGFPMRPDVGGPTRMKVLLSGGAGFCKGENGMRRAKTIRGSMISDETMQINCVVTSAGDKPLAELMPKVESKKVDKR